jgi:hypothetical protein
MEKGEVGRLGLGVVIAAIGAASFYGAVGTWEDAHRFANEPTEYVNSVIVAHPSETLETDAGIMAGIGTAAWITAGLVAAPAIRNRRRRS